MAGDSTKSLIILGVAAVGAWYLYEQGYLYQWTGIAALYPGVPPATTVPPGSNLATTVPASTTATVPATTTTAAPSTTTTTTSTPTVTLAGPVSADINDSLAANVSINGTVQNVACIPGGGCYDTEGHGVTLPSGVTAAQIYALMKASSGASGSGGTSGIGMFGSHISMRSIHGVGYARLRRGAIQ